MVLRLEVSALCSCSGEGLEAQLTWEPKFLRVLYMYSCSVNLKMICQVVLDSEPRNKNKITKPTHANVSFSWCKISPFEISYVLN